MAARINNLVYSNKLRQVVTLHLKYLPESILCKLGPQLLFTFYLTNIGLRNLLLLTLDEWGKVCGFAAVVWWPSPELLFLVVDRQHQGKGYGRKMLMEIKRTLKKRGLQKLQVKTITTNERANRFYLQTGFKFLKTGQSFGHLFNYYVLDLLS